MFNFNDIVVSSGTKYANDVNDVEYSTSCQEGEKKTPKNSLGMFSLHCFMLGSYSISFILSCQTCQMEGKG